MPLGAFFVSGHFGKQHEKAETPDRVYITVVSTQPHNPMFRDAHKRPVYHT